jgi:hypothetical protein
VFLDESFLWADFEGLIENMDQKMGSRESCHVMGVLS